MDAQHNLITRLWQKDLSLWRDADADTDTIANRLGWLDAVTWMETHVDELARWAQPIIDGGKFDNVILLGMGGSSLAAEVFSAVFDSADALQLQVMDSTSPAQINALDVDLTRSLIIVSSKSGSTVETADLLAYFQARLRQVTDCPGNHLIAITDPDSWLHQHAVENGFTQVFLNPADIGGRYSALSYFGLVPAALIGIDLHRLLAQTSAFRDRCQADAAHSVSGSVWQLAELMGNAALSASNILHLRLAPQLQSLAVWIEQLVAESLGKDGKGILPIYDDSGDDSPQNPSQRNISSVYIGLDGENKGAERQTKSAMPTDMQWHLASRYDIGGEFLRWEMATALAASIMAVNPFDQPDVEQAKQQTRLFISGQQSQSFNPLFENSHYAVSGNMLGNMLGKDSTADVFNQFGIATVETLYLAMLAYLPNFAAVNDRLQALRRRFAQRFGLTTTLGYGPRYLHSTGQLHKGGPANGCFIQLIEQTMAEIAIPERPYSFADLHRAQADGDYAVLAQKGRPLMRITLKGDRLVALDKLLADIIAA